MSFKLDKKKKKLRAIKEHEFILKEKSSSLESMLESKNQELRQMNALCVEFEVLKNTDIINSREMLKMIARL
jgi:hypothetical protein